MPNDTDTVFGNATALYNDQSIKDHVEREMKQRKEFIDALQKAYDDGEDISEYVWPYEWDLRQRPEPHISNNVISLADAVDLCGQLLFVDDWTLYDWYARERSHVDKWSPNDDIYRACDFSNRTKYADFKDNEEAEKDAYTRKRDVYGKLGGLLNQNKINAFTLDKEGNKQNIPNNIWLSSDVIKVFDEGKIDIKENGTTKIGGRGEFVYLDKEALEKNIPNQSVPNKTKDRKLMEPDGITCPEGLWIIEAIFLLNEKLYGNNAGKEKMGNGVRSIIEVLVTNHEIEVFTIHSHGGEKKAIKRDYLRGREPTRDFLRGFIPYSDGFHTSKEDGQFIFVNKDHFEKYLNDEPIIQLPVKSSDQSNYIPAYMGLMLKGVGELSLSPDKRADMDSIIEWLNNNWPSDMDGKSARLIKYMATLMRRPEDKKGGNTAYKK